MALRTRISRKATRTRAASRAADAIPARQPERRDAPSRSPATVLRADRVYGHAAQDRPHARGTLGSVAPAGSKVRQSRTEPPARARQQRRSPRSGAR